MTDKTVVTVDVEDAIDNPEKYGFSWGYGHLDKNKMQITSGNGAPRIEHKNLPLMIASFGEEYFLASANGQSARVRDQTIREDIWANRALASDDRAMKRLVLEKALGTRARRRSVTVVEKIVEVAVEVRIYVADDGQEFTDKAEMLAHNVDLKLAAQ